MKPRQRFKPNLVQRAALRVLGVKRNAIGDPSGVPLLNNMRRGVGTDPLLGLDDNLDYVGYMGAAIRNRAVKTARLATEHLQTKWKNPDTDTVHPYLTLIEDSPTFTDYRFWVAMSHFLDLGKGAAYILAVRAIDGDRIGKVQEFKILNPFQVQKYRNQSTKQVMFIETKDGMQREIPEKMIIEVLSFNPLNMSQGYPISTMAKADQYLNQQAGKYTGQAMKNNVGQRGMLVTEVLLEDEEFINFRNQVEAQAGIEGAGKFLYGNGPGSLSYVDMQIDLDKLALESIDKTSLNRLLAVTGMSRTSLGIEESGVTRDTSKAQTDRLTDDHIIPQVQSVIDALNQDYRNAYKDDQRPKIIVDNPLKTDREAEKTDAETTKIKTEAVKNLIMAGFDPSAALETVELEDMPFVGIPEAAHAAANAPAQKNTVHSHDHDPIFSTNDLSTSLRAIVAGQQSTLETDVHNVQRKIVQSIVAHLDTKKLTRNQIAQAQQDEIIDPEEKQKHEDELAAVLAAFFLSMIPLFAGQTIKQRLKQFGLPSSFKMDADTKSFIEDHAKASAASHTNTILEEIYKVANDAAIAGKSRPQIVSEINRTYTDVVSKAQAKRIARTEANRSVAEAQYRADKQFVHQNELGARAFKRWVTRSGNPCRYCLELQRQTARNPIPFDADFVKQNDSVSVSEEDAEGKTVTKTYVAGYENVGSGTLHPNCSCIYELIIKEG